MGRLIATLLCCMDSIRENSQIVCIAATESCDQLDGGLVRFGRFDRQIEIGNLDEDGRLEIYKIHTRNMTLADDIDLSAINKEKPDLSGSQIAALCSEAALQCLRKEMDTINISHNAIDCEILKNLRVTQENFEHAGHCSLAVSRPS